MIFSKMALGLIIFSASAPLFAQIVSVRNEACYQKAVRDCYGSRALGGLNTYLAIKDSAWDAITFLDKCQAIESINPACVQSIDLGQLKAIADLQSTFAASLKENTTEIKALNEVLKNALTRFSNAVDTQTKAINEIGSAKLPAKP